MSHTAYHGLVGLLSLLLVSTLVRLSQCQQQEENPIYKVPHFRSRVEEERSTEIVASTIYGKVSGHNNSYHTPAACLLDLDGLSSRLCYMPRL